MINITTVSGQSDLAGILDLQRRNLKKYLTEEEAASEGFLIAEFSMDYLKKMNDAHPSVVAKIDNQVVGYALIATQAARVGHPLTEDLFNQIDSLSFDGIQLNQAKYAVIGQLCVDKSVRGMGLVQQLYGRFREELENEYDFGITDVARANSRSLKAHVKTGFQVIHSIGYGGIEWDVVLWDWRKQAAN